MPGWNGSGAFTRLYSWVADDAAGIDILASRMDGDTNLITTQGFNNCLTRDGQGSAIANLPMNAFKHTNVGNATAADEYVALGQLQSPASLPLIATTLTTTGAGNIGGNATVGGTLFVTTNSTIGGTLGVTGNASVGGTFGVTGAISGAVANFTNLDASGTFHAGSTATFGASVTVSGGTSTPVANTGEYGQFAVAYNVSTSVTYSLIAVNSIIANTLWATSDARVKTDIQEISPDDAYDWILRGRPVTYLKSGVHEAGFIAQDELRSGRGASISMVNDATMVATDELSPAGVRLVKNYEHEIAYLTAALQGALKRLEMLEKRTA